jgi:hypothetical protein
VQIGGYGEKKDPIGAQAYLDVQNQVKSEHLAGRVKFNTAIRVVWSETTQADVEVNGQMKVFGLGVAVAAGMPYARAVEDRVDLVNFSIAEGPLTRMLIEDADGALKFLAGEGGDGRIVSEVWVVMAAELSAHFSVSPSIDVSVGLGGSELAVTASGGRQGTQTVRLSPGTTFAYKLHKVKTWNQGKTRIVDMEADYKGMA